MNVHLLPRRVVGPLFLCALSLVLGLAACDPSDVSPRVGSLCGGVAGTDCGGRLYCDYAADGGAPTQGIGRCAEKPPITACILLYRPVCGIDGKTYSNDCFAAAAGVTVAHQGECEPDVPGCPAVYDPVCGADGTSYGNECEALAAGTTVAHTGVCDGGACSGPAPEAANVLCSDGSVGGPACVCDAAGCRWIIRVCPPAPDFCGGIAGFPCPSGQFCDFPQATQCGSGDQGGTCRDIPEACTLEYAPVCGCDGKTYGNACGAAGAGVSVLHPGGCDTTTCDATECGPGPASPLPYDCVRDAGGACTWQLACVPIECAAPPIGCSYVGGDLCHCGMLVCDPPL